MSLDSLLDIFGPAFIVLSALIAIIALAVLGFVATILIGAMIDKYQNRRRRMATPLSKDELALRRLQKHLERRLQIRVNE